MDCQCKSVLLGVGARLSSCLGLTLLWVGLVALQRNVVAQESIQESNQQATQDSSGEVHRESLSRQGKVRISADGQSFVRGGGKTDGGASGHNEMSADGESFVGGEPGQPFVPWGFNYLGEFGKLVEESWDSDWARIERDFQEMRGLGANVVRIHLQYGTYMKGPGEYAPEQFDRLRKLLDLSAEAGLVLDITGLSCYRLENIPAWYDALDEAQRWDAQADWWSRVAKTCAGHPAVFCYDLMNEPIVGGSPEEGAPRWVGGELGGLYFVQRISQDAAGRANADIAQAWVAKLTAAIREQDPATPITVGVIPWAFVWPNAKPLFYSPEVAQHLDFVSIHAYPDRGKVAAAIAALAVYDIGKPLVVEETFPLNCTIDDMDLFIEGGRDRVDGWISHYFGYTIAEHAAGAEPVGTAPDAPFGMSVAEFFEYWRDKGKTIVTEAAQPSVESPQAALPTSAADHVADKAAILASAIDTGELTVRGSVEQIYIVHACPNVPVVVSGPGNLQIISSTDELGGLIVRGLAPGSGYRVSIVDGSDVSHEAQVLSRDEHPAASFYSTQQLEPSQGFIETRDGTLLAYRVVLPDRDIYGMGPYDLVITYSGYQPSLSTTDSYQNKPFEQFTSLGYAVAGVNMRGTAGSGGAFHFMEPLTWLDGYDVVEAFGAQGWVDDIALGDQSWPGLTQLYVAAMQPPALDAIVAGSVVGDFYRDVFYPGGIPNVGFAQIWASGRDQENAFPSSRPQINERVKADPISAANQGLRGQSVSLLETVQQRPCDDAFWQGMAAESLVSKIRVPVLQVASWQDPQVSGRAAMLSTRFASGTPVRLIGVNGFHQYWSGAVWEEVERFLDVYLGDTAPAQIDDYESQNAFVALLESNADGEVRGRFSLASIDAAGEGQTLVLGEDLLADERPDETPDRPGATSSFMYQSKATDGWSNIGGHQATFTSTSLERDTVMAGCGSVNLWIAAESKDVDLQISLSEVRPDRQDLLIQSGWLRASHRAVDEQASTVLRPRQLHTAESCQQLIPSEWTRLRIELFPFAHVFRQGSRIRLSVAGPGGAVNAWPWAFDALPGGFEVRVALGSDGHISTIALPVVHPADLDLTAMLPAADSVWLQPCRLLQETFIRQRD